jgi:hypothetical protein
MSDLGYKKSASVHPDKTRYEKNVQSDRSQVSRDVRFDRSCPGQSYFMHDTGE